MMMTCKKHPEAAVVWFGKAFGECPLCGAISQLQAVRAELADAVVKVGALKVQCDRERGELKEEIIRQTKLAEYWRNEAEKAKAEVRAMMLNRGEREKEMGALRMSEWGAREEVRKVQEENERLKEMAELVRIVEGKSGGIK